MLLPKGYRAETHYEAALKLYFLLQFDKLGYDFEKIS